MRSTFALVLIPLIAAAAAAEEIVDGIAAQVGGDVWLNEREAANSGGVNIQDD